MIDDVIDILIPLRTFVYGDGVRKDNLIFRILTKHTSFVFFVCFVINVMCLNLSDPINCISDKEVENVIDSFCWIKAMYTLPTKPEEGLVIHEGVRQQEPSDQLLVHHFYQFVYSILFLQCGLLYIPRIIWNGLENGRMSSYKEFLDKISPLAVAPPSESDDKEEKMKITITIDKDLLEKLHNDTESGDIRRADLYTEKIKEVKKKSDDNKAKLAKYLYEQFHHYNFYAYRFVMCELLALANIILNIYLMNLYLGDTFITYGMDLLVNFSFEEESLVLKYPSMQYFTRTNQITSRIFPKVTKCTMRVTGPGGNIVPYDALCVLTINIVNQAMYFFLWWWLAYILCMSVGGIVYRFAFMCSAWLRVTMLQRYMHKDKIKKISEHTKFHYNLLLKEIKFSDWFVLYMVRKNTDMITFTEVMIEMADQAVTSCEEKRKANCTLLKGDFHQDEVDFPYSNKNRARTSNVHHTRPRGTLRHRESEDVFHDCQALTIIEP